MEIKQGKPLQLLPPAPGKCPICAEAKHGPELPHNRDSLFYQFKFHGEHGRSPTWADAAADCNDATWQEWEKNLKLFGVSAEAIGVRNE